MKSMCGTCIYTRQINFTQVTTARDPRCNTVLRKLPSARFEQYYHLIRIPPLSWSFGLLCAYRVCNLSTGVTRLGAVIIAGTCYARVFRTGYKTRTGGNKDINSRVQNILGIHAC